MTQEKEYDLKNFEATKQNLGTITIQNLIITFQYWVAK